MLTDKEFFDVERKAGITPENKGYLNLHYGLADWIIKTCKPEHYFEIGIGMGTCLERVLREGNLGYGYDPNQYHTEFFKTRNPILSERALDSLKDAKKHLKESDTVCAIECMEHMTDEVIHDYLKSMSSCKYFVFSSTSKRNADPKKDEDWGHINVKEQNEWVELFAQYGFKLNGQRPPITSWAKLFTRA